MKTKQQIEDKYYEILSTINQYYEYYAKNKYTDNEEYSEDHITYLKLNAQLIALDWVLHNEVVLQYEI